MQNELKTKGVTEQMLQKKTQKQDKKKLKDKRFWGGNKKMKKITKKR